MDGITVCFTCDTDDVCNVEVSLDRPLAVANEVAFVGLETVQGEAVLPGIYGDRADAEFVRGPHDPDRDLAAVGDQQPLDSAHAGF